MRILADENIESQFVDRLRHCGNDVKYVAEAGPAMSDAAVLRLSLDEQRVLFTGDKDFGELIFFRGQAAFGVVLLRFASDELLRNMAILERVLPQIEAQVEGHFVVVMDDLIRVRPLVVE